MAAITRRTVLAAWKAGRIVNERSSGARRPLDAEVIRECVRQPGADMDPRGLRIRRAHILGELDLAGMRIARLGGVVDGGLDIATMLGWMMTTIFVLSLSRFARTV